MLITSNVIRARSAGAGKGAARKRHIALQERICQDLPKKGEGDIINNARRDFMSQKSKIAAFTEEAYRVTVTGRHVQVTEPMKDYAIDKLLKLERFSPRLIDIYVTMDIQKLEHRVDVVMQYDTLKIKTHAVSGDMYSSVDLVVNKLKSQIRKYKDQIQEHHFKNQKSEEMNVKVIRAAGREAELRDFNQEIEEANSEALVKNYLLHKVVAQEKKLLKTLRMDEALMKMELSGDHFLLFRSEEDPKKKLKVLYRKTDGEYGLIEPEG
jgi:putative sigma-54 modulation protein